MSEPTTVGGWLDQWHSGTLNAVLCSHLEKIFRALKTKDELEDVKRKLGDVENKRERYRSQISFLRQKLHELREEEL